MSTPFARSLVALLICVGLALGQLAHAAPTFPPLTGRVIDEAGVLTPQAEAELSGKLESLESQTARQLVVVTVSSLQGYEIEEYGYQLGREWGIGEARKDTGVLFIVAPKERRTRIEVGYGLEPVLTDAFSNAIIQDKVLPRFRENDITGGIQAGVQALIEQLSLPADQAEAVVAGTASGEATADPFATFLIGLVVFWLVAGVIGAIGGRRTDIWFWPLFFLMRGSGRSRDMFRGRGGSFGGGGASGRW